MFRMAGAGGFAMLIALSTVDAFSVGSFVAPRAGLPLAGKAGGLCARSALASPRRVLGLQMSEGLEQEERIRVARKLAEDAKAAMDSAKEAEAKANTFRGKEIPLALPTNLGTMPQTLFITKARLVERPERPQARFPSPATTACAPCSA